MIEIVQRGHKSDEEKIKYSVTCYTCNSLLKADHEDTRPMGTCRYFICPVCKADVVFLTGPARIVE
jgi:hypothetical protein